MKFGFFTSHTISNFVVIVFFVTDKRHYYYTIIKSYILINNTNS